VLLAPCPADANTDASGDAGAMAWVAFAAGLALVVCTGVAVLFTLVLPRARSGPQRLSIAVNRAVRLVFVGASHFVGPYERVDAMLSPVGPVAVLVQLVVWLGLFFVGFTLMQLPFTGSLGSAAPGTGASLFTVGLARTGGTPNSFITIVAAGTGAIVVALQIGYLPAIYSAFARREALVTMLESRSGIPAWGPELLARHRLVRITDTLPGLYREWEVWAAEVSESHTSYPVLLLFRSPETWYSWVLAMIAVLDAAAMQLALNPDTAPSEARLCLRMGFTALRRIATSMGWPYDPDPLPEAPITLTFEEFSHAVDLLHDAGFGTERSAPEAWPHFRGWRVNYEALAYRLADRTVAPPAPWSGPRRHLRAGAVAPARPSHRAPGGTTSSHRLAGRTDPAALPGAAGPPPA